MPRFIYSVWFRDQAAAPDDQDYEWVACILVDAEASHQALSWGDHLASRRASGSDDIVLSSKVEDYEGTPDLPLVQFGEEATDEVIGW